MTTLLHLLLLSLSLSLLPFLLRCECPNGCSGHGDCGARDQCSCYIGYMGNDCASHTCPFGYAHVDTPKGDLNFAGGITTSLLSISTPLYPNGAIEGFPASANTDEGHFYMECSNNGLCDRKSGDCECFDAYEGHACQRQACPNACSNKGMCNTMSQLATKAGGSTTLGTLSSVGEAATGVTTYNLWDKELIQGCACDPWYSGPDCSLRDCKVGIDALYADRNIPLYLKFFLALGSDGTATFSSSLSSFRLRLYDYHGEVYLTEVIDIPALSGSASVCPLCAPVVAAVAALPNDPFPSFECAASENTYAQHVTTDGYEVHLLECTFTDAPGALRLPSIANLVMKDSTTLEDIAAATIVQTVTGTTLRGEDTDWTPTYHGLVAITNAATDANTALATTYAATLGATTEPTLLRIANQYLVASTATAALIWAWPLDTTAEARLYSAPAGTLTEGDAVVTFAHASTVMTTGEDAITVVSRGDWLIYDNQVFKVVSTTDATGASTITVDRPFYGTAITGAGIATGTLKYYKITPPSTAMDYVGECSFKGLCDHSTGLCECFKGYTSDNCESQNALAL